MAASTILVSTICVNVCMGEVAGSGIESTYAEHTRAVELARRGQHEEGLNVLRPLLERFPDNYPLQRDFILITIWKGDCEGALQRFGRIRQERRLEPYFIVQVSHCLLIKSQFQEAIELIQSGLKRYPEHTDLQQALVRVKHTQAVELARAGNYEVLKGDNLWNISGKPSVYADPYQWPVIYTANSDQIRDPDLIYPGQVLTIDPPPLAYDVDAAIQHAKTRDSWALGVVAGSGIESTYADHTRAVELARRGQYEEALNILRPLLERFPDDYPLQRDFILITIWKGDCEEALQRFEGIQQKERLEPYFIVQLSHCQIKQSQFQEAIELIQSGLERYPQHPDLQQALVRVKHAQAIALARAGNYDEGLNILDSLLLRYPDDYPLQRDAILITIWKGDCEDAVRRFHKLSGQPAFEPYFIIPVSDCLLATNRPLEAISLIRSGLEQYPEHKGLEHALAKAMIAYRIDKRTDAGYPVIGVRFSLEPSEGGLYEWLTELQASTKIAERTRLYARYLISRSSESEYEAGELNRLGIGIRYHFNEQLSIAQAFSTDIQKSNQGGSDTELQYQPYDTWKFAAGYTTFAEDVPLRARANDIDANGWYGSAVYDSTDYVWHWRLVTSQYDFSDDNLRTSFFTTAGYAYEMLPHREQRLFLEWYQSSNTRDDAPYYNPKRDRSVGLVHKTDFVFESRFLRHVDHLYLMAGAYTQEGYGTHGTWGIRYEQDYDFDETQALVFSIGVNRNIYDGEPEIVGHFGLNYKKRF